MALYDVDKLMVEARRIAAAYRKATGKSLGISSEIAKHDVSRLMNLELVDNNQSGGFDAIGRGTRAGRRVQIKARAVFDESKSGQRVGQMKLEQDWDSVMLLIMDENYEAMEIYEADRDALLQAIGDAGRGSRGKRGGMSVARFKIISKLVWARGEGVIEDEIWDNQADRD